MQGLPDLARAETFDVWVYRTSRNRCIDHFRRRRFETSLPTLDERAHPLWAADLRPPDESVQAGEARARLRQALETLPPAWRQAIVLRGPRSTLRAPDWERSASPVAALPMVAADLVVSLQLAPRWRSW